MAKYKRGRPKKINDDVLRKLEYAFSYGLTDKEACVVADIAPSTLYKYCEQNPLFSERKEELKNQPIIKAKMNLVDALKAGDAKTSVWYLERKARGEFGNVQKIEHAGTIELPLHEKQEITERYYNELLSKQGIDLDDV
ncbi:hypothetical protein NRIC_03800 [Enterococcus florum]|uniref:Uncharacterized protein n=1 Tax=Enterococcus florum TaxID=2480627 RepID=A0A4V0WP36_9ENTE|nr:hypothetical protein [Enterococcus florum]GCF92489.1 hypothetical protein NRIC_03800 [Enterococcus florum]